MDREAIQEKLQSLFRVVFDDNTIELLDAMTAEDVEEWDSLNHINLIVAVEKEFGIRFTTREVYAANTVGEFIDMLQACLRRQGKINL